MIWLWVGPIFLFLLALAALFPYASIASARCNARRSNGKRSARRSRRERHHLLAFVRRGVALPFVLLVVLQGAFFGIHLYAVPDTAVLAELFGEYHPEVSLHAPDLEAWNDAIEADRRDREYAAQEVAQGNRPATVVPLPAAVREALLAHWPAHIAFLVLSGAYLVWAFRRRFLPAARMYHRGVLRRAATYRLRSAIHS